MKQIAGQSESAPQIATQNGAGVWITAEIYEPEDGTMMEILRQMWADDQGQDIAEYAVMLAVILVIVVGTVKLIGSNANNVFSNVASSLTQ